MYLKRNTSCKMFVTSAQSEGMTIDSAVRLNLEQNKYDYLKYFSFFSTRFYLSLSGGYIDQVLASWKIRTELFCLLRKEMCFKVVDL